MTDPMDTEGWALPADAGRSAALRAEPPTGSQGYRPAAANAGALPDGLSKRARRRLRAEAARRGAIYLPGDTPGIPWDQRRRWEEQDRQFFDADKRLGESLERSRQWIAEREQGEGK